MDIMENMTENIIEHGGGDQTLKNEKCSVCLGTLVEPTSLESCDHTFCYGCIRRWLLHCEANSCPLCKKPISILLKFDHEEGEPATSKISIDDLQRELLDERTAARCNAVPLTNERFLITRRIHELRVYITRLENGQGGRADYQTRVSQLTALRLLTQSIDDRSISRGELVSNSKFREIIYCMDAPAYIVDPNSNPLRRNFTVTYCRETLLESRGRVMPFIRNELGVIASLLKHDAKLALKSASRRETLAEAIFNLCEHYQIMSPPFKSALIKLGLASGVTERFQHELFEFASSQLTIQQYWNIVGYKGKEVRVVSRNRGNRNGDIPVVILDDSEIQNNDEDDILVIESDPEQDISDVVAIDVGTNEAFFRPPISVDSFGQDFMPERVIGRYRNDWPHIRAANLNKTTVVLSSDEDSSDEQSIERMDTSIDSIIPETEKRQSSDLDATSNSESLADNKEKNKKKHHRSTKYYQNKCSRRISKSIKSGSIREMREWVRWLRSAGESLARELENKQYDKDRHRDRERERERFRERHHGWDRDREPEHDYHQNEENQCGNRKKKEFLTVPCRPNK